MNPKVSFIAESIKKFIRRKAHTNLLKLIHKVHPSELAAAISILKQRERDPFFDFLIKKDISLTSEILIELDDSILHEFMQSQDEKDIALILKELNTDDAVSLIEDLPDEKKEAILSLIQDSSKVEEQLLYTEETAGRIMSRNFFYINDQHTVKEAIQELQKLEENAEMVFYLYLVDDHGNLTGVLSLRQLLLSSPQTSISEIMNRNVISVRVDMDQEDVADIVSQYDLLAVPVVDLENKLVGIITVDDVIDIIREEAEEDIYKMVGTSEEELLYKGNPFKIAKIRMPWLIPAFIGVLIVSILLSNIEFGFKYFAIFVVFMPIINASAGNIGIQSTTIIARELAFNRIEKGQWKEIFLNQIKLGFLIGITLGILAFAFSYFTTSGKEVNKLIVGGSVGIAMLTAITISTVYGSMIPIILKRLGFDPSVSTGPFVAASNDLIGVITYFSIAWSGVSYFSS